MSKVKVRSSWTKPYELEEENKQLKREIKRFQELKEEFESDQEIFYNISRLLIFSVIGLSLLCIYLAGH